MSEDVCIYCAGDEEGACTEVQKDPEDSMWWYCTRPLDHEGDHVACGTGEGNHDLHHWEKKK